MELDSIISKRAGSEEEKRCSSLSSKVQACQNKILGMERELDKEEEGNAEIKSRNISKRMIISSIYTLMGELASQAQSRIAHRLETQYVRSQKFKTRESGRLSSECGLARNPSESGGPYCGDLDEGVEDLTPEMERAAQELLNHFTSDLDALRESQRQLHEISSLMSFFSTKIQEQSEICSNILTDANDAVDHLDESTIYIQRLEEIYGKKSRTLVLSKGGRESVSRVAPDLDAVIQD
ncbi:hypothetical protein OIY81_1874 [Cryptosporidium canis]|nr:hypothetical protein OIY81_1874 [Cryptosporidium canis]